MKRNKRKMELNISFSLSDETISNLIMACMHSQHSHSHLHQSHLPECMNAPQSQREDSQNPLTNLLNPESLNKISSIALPILLNQLNPKLSGKSEASEASGKREASQSYEETRDSVESMKNETSEESGKSEAIEDLLDQTLDETLNQKNIYFVYMDKFCEYILKAAEETSKEGNPDDVIDGGDFMFNNFKEFVKDDKLGESVVASLLIIKNSLTESAINIRREDLLPEIKKYKNFIDQFKFLFRTSQ